MTSEGRRAELALKAHAHESVLGRIIRAKIEDLAARERVLPRSEIARDLTATDRGFERALRAGGGRSGASPRPRLIGEIKRRSPSRGVLRETLDISAIGQIYETRAAAISVVTDGPFFGGSLEMLREARAATSRPLLMKDFVLSEYQVVEARAFGADAILLMASVLEPDAIEGLLELARTYAMEAVVEVHTDEELELIRSKTSARIIGVNNRDLRTLVIDRENVHRLAPRVDPSCIVVAESGLSSKSEIDRLEGVADAVLIGTALMQAPDIAARIQELGF